MVVLTSLPPPYPHLLETLNWRRGEKERGRRFAPSSPPFPSFFRLPRRLPPALAREFRKGGQTRAGGSAEKRRRERVPSPKNHSKPNTDHKPTENPITNQNKNTPKPNPPPSPTHTTQPTQSPNNPHHLPPPNPRTPHPTHANHKTKQKKRDTHHQARTDDPRVISTML